MTRDIGAPELRRHLRTLDAARTLALEPELIGLGAGEPAAKQRATGDTPCARMTRICRSLHQMHEELLRAHTSTVVALAHLRSERERMGRTLAEAREQHETLLLVRAAAEVLEAVRRRLGGRPA